MKRCSQRKLGSVWILALCQSGERWVRPEFGERRWGESDYVYWTFGGNHVTHLSSRLGASYDPEYADISQTSG